MEITHGGVKRLPEGVEFLCENEIKMRRIDFMV